MQLNERKKDTMSFQRIILTSTLWMKAVLCSVLIFGYGAVHYSPLSAAPPPSAVAVNQPAADVTEQQPRRIPPRAAIEACAGKTEDDPCSFVSSRGPREGVCKSGRENIFACRPNRDGIREDEASPPRPAQGKAVQNVPPVQPAVKQAESVQKNYIQPGTVSIAETPSPIPAVSHGKEAGLALDKTAPVSSQVPGSPAQDAPFEHLSGALSGLGSHIVVALLAAFLVWYGFFRFSILPLRRLRTVTQQLASGDLSARVGGGLVHRKNEVADLGRDVDRMAERIESLVGAHQRLIRDVSHELRSPLARLNVALELARQSAGAAHSAPFDRIEQESDRLNELIGQLLMLTKLESENSINTKSEMDIGSLIREVAQDVDFEAGSNERSVSAAGCESLLLSGNRELLRQALENLVRNAARYTEKGTAVEITLRKKESGGRNWAHIEVRDQGPGVPESELNDIFRPFYRVSDSRERQSGGAGVGLAISDRAVRLHGGSLRAINAVGGGLIMEMELPLT